MNDIDVCHDYCSTRQSCVGYQYQWYEQSKRQACFLFPADESCPSEFQLYKGQYTAKSSYDLVPGHEQRAMPGIRRVCYAKRPGKID